MAMFSPSSLACVSSQRRLASAASLLCWSSCALVLLSSATLASYTSLSMPQPPTSATAINSAANLMGLSFRLLLVALVDIVDDAVDLGGVIGRLVHVEVPIDALVQARLDVLGGIAEAQEQAGAIF